MGAKGRGCMILPLLSASLVLLGTAPQGLRLEGTFVQYSDALARRTVAEWHKDLNAAREAGLRIIIVQWLKYGDRDYMSLSDGPDPTQVILEYADHHRMQVFLGLAGDPAWFQRWNDPAYLETAARECERVAEQAWKRYGKHRSFAGWYIPQESWDMPLSDEQLRSLTGFYRRIADRCRTLSGALPVATAPFFSGLMAPDRVREVYSKLLDGAGIDIVMLQDGVGARGWDDRIEERVVPYFVAFRDACVTAGVELWSDLECFQSRSGEAGFVSASPERILEQLAAAAPFVRRFVTFDFFHYMSPYRNDRAKALYDGYVAACVRRPYFPHLGRSMQVDPTFTYYRDRSPASIAAELRAAGYGVIHYVVVNDDDIDRQLIEAFRQYGMGVWYLTFGNGTYRTAGLPAGWEAWRMVTRSDLEGRPLNDGYTRLCLNQPEYRRWKKTRMAQVLREYPFVGVEIAEPHWPEYPGPTSPAYACFCSHCLQAFRRMFPEEESLPEILDTSHPRHIDRNPELREKWIRFRIASLTDFLQDLLNGPGGLRETSPHAKVCTWTLALLGPDGLQKVREIHGEDAAEIVRVVKPDVHCLQTHWPDWMRADLAGDYIRGYEPFLTSIKAVSPELPVVFQADTGSQPQNRRSWEWIRLFENTCRRLGAQGGMSYEYFIGDYIYSEPPRVVEVTRIGSTVTLSFTKRLHGPTAAEPSRYTVTRDQTESERPLPTVEVKSVDGSLVTLVLNGVAEHESVRLTLTGLQDDPDRRLFRDRPACTLESQTIRIPAACAGSNQNAGKLSSPSNKKRDHLPGRQAQWP